MPCEHLRGRDGRVIGVITLDPEVPPPSKRPRVIDEGCEPFKRRGFLDWMAFADEMSTTHDQVKCPACGCFHVWKRKRRKRP